MDRRRFLSLAVCAGACAALAGGCAPCVAPSDSSAGEAIAPADRKLVIVLFGGGTRSSESMADPDHRYVPRLWKEMVPRGTLYTDVRVDGPIVHTNCAAAIVTGHEEYGDLDWSRPPANPTIFEMHRKARRSADTDAFAFVYASIHNQLGHSRDPECGARFAANAIEPPTIRRAAAEEMDRVLREASASGLPDAERGAARRCAQIARDSSRINRDNLRSDAARVFLDRQFAQWKRGSGTTSHDAFLADCATAAMDQFTPSVIFVAFGEIDCAHYGSWSRYTDAIARTDELTWRLWQHIEQSPAYRGRTLMLVLPDHGRQLESASGPGFIHHSDFYKREGEDDGCRRVWMLAMGPSVAQGTRIERAIANTAANALARQWMGL